MMAPAPKTPKRADTLTIAPAGAAAPADAGGVPLASDTATSGLQLGGGQPDVGDQHATGTAVAPSGITAGDSLAARFVAAAQSDRDLYLVIERVLHNGETFVAGDLISLTGKEADPLLGSFIVPDAE